MLQVSVIEGTQQDPGLYVNLRAQFGPPSDMLPVPGRALMPGSCRRFLCTLTRPGTDEHQPVSSSAMLDAAAKRLVEVD